MTARPEPGSVQCAARFARALAAHGRRRLLRRLMEGLAMCCGIVAIVLLAVLVAMDHFHFAPAAVRAARVLFWCVVTVAVAGFVLPRAVQPVGRRELAFYVEGRARELDALVLSAVAVVEGRAARGASSALVSRMLGEAADRLEALSGLVGSERRRIRRGAGLSLAALVLAMIPAVFGPPGLRHGASLLFWPGVADAGSMPYRLSLVPGDATIVEGVDQSVVARATGFSPREAQLLVRADGKEAWREVPMVADAEPGRFDAMLLNLARSIEYYAVAEGVESPRYRLEVEPPLTVSRIDLVYRYPERTGRPPEHVDDGGDIRAVERTTVEITVTPSAPVATGVLRLDGERELVMRAADGVLTATLEVERDGYYHVELPVAGGVMRRASRDYAIDAMVDTRPSARIVSPGADIDATRVEEVGLELVATDDVAIRNLELVLWVNGAEEEVVRFSVPDGATEFAATKRLHLEDRALKPGDLIAYHARATDVAGDPERSAASDIYFIQVRPFDRRFSRAPGGGGGGGQSMDGMLSAQQRQLVVALFRLVRLVDPAAAGDRVETLSTAQARIRERVDAIIRRLRARSIPGIEATVDPVTEELPKASDAMLRVEARLGAADFDGALTSARNALLHLQRADAGLKEMQVAINNGGGGAANDLSNLFNLEMDRFRSPYEGVQRGRPEASRELDDTLRKLAELAQRQQREVERRGPQGANGPSGAQRDLAARTRELLRQLERLTRERSDPALEQARDAARRAADAMSGGGPAGRRQALRELREAERALRELKGEGIAGSISGALRRADALVDRQRAVKRGLDALRIDPGDGASLDRVLDEKETLADGARQLDADLERLANASPTGSGERDALARSRRALDAGGLGERMADSGRRLAEGAVEESAEIEGHIGRALEAARDALGEAREAAAASRRREGESAEALRQLVRAEDRLQQQLIAGARAAGSAVGESGAGAFRGGTTGGDGRAGGGTAGGGSFDGRLDMADVRRRFIEDAQKLAALGDGIDPALREGGDIEALVGALRELGASEVGLGDLVLGHARLLAELKDLERRARGGAEAPDPGLVVRDTPQPEDDFRALVEAYYRRLSDTAGGASPR